MNIIEECVSVVVPAYNASRWAESIVTSIKTNSAHVGELILVNDGDKDDFDELVEKVQAYLSLPVLCFSTDGREGPGKARNIGINNASFSYIAFLDCDDQWLPDSLRKRLNLLSLCIDAPFVYSSYYRVSLDGLVTNITRVPAVAKLEMLFATNFIATPSVVIRRSSIGGMRFKQVGHEDYDFWLRLIQASGVTAVGLVEPVIRVVTSAGSVSHVKKDAFRWHYEILRSNGVPLALRIILFAVYAINGLLKRKVFEYKPIFFCSHHITRQWLLRHKLAR